MDIALKSSNPIDLTASSDLKRPADAHEAAQDFEALMISQMLKSARGSGNWMGVEAKGSNPMMAMAEEQLARSMAAHGVFGIARILEQSAGDNEAVSSPEQPAASLKQGEQLAPSRPTEAS